MHIFHQFPIDRKKNITDMTGKNIQTQETAA